MTLQAFYQYKENMERLDILDHIHGGRKLSQHAPCLQDQYVKYICKCQPLSQVTESALEAEDDLQIHPLVPFPSLANNAPPSNYSAVPSCGPASFRTWVAL